MCACLFLVSGLASGLELTTTGPASIEKASGQSVRLECQFTLAREDTGPLDIEWSLMASDNQQEDKVVCVDLMLQTHRFHWQLCYFCKQILNVACCLETLLAAAAGDSSPDESSAVGRSQHSFYWKEFLRWRCIIRVQTSLITAAAANWSTHPTS